MRDLALPIKSYQLQFCSEAGFALDSYSTSAWRGGMGHALKRVLCRAGATDHCSACIGRMECSYPNLFELAALGSKSPPVPYMLRTPQGALSLLPGMGYELGLTLIGPAAEHESLYIGALSSAALQGIGPERGRFSLAGVNSLTASPLIAPSEKMEITFLSLMRVGHHGKYLNPETFDFAAWFQSLLWRATSLGKAYGSFTDFDVQPLIRAAAALKIADSKLHWRDVDRHSSRQQTRMKLGGLLGRFTIEGDTEPLRPWLELGVQLHVGKNASMGYGMFGVKSL